MGLCSQKNSKILKVWNWKWSEALIDIWLEFDYVQMYVKSMVLGPTVLELQQNSEIANVILKMKESTLTIWL